MRLVMNFSGEKRAACLSRDGEHKVVSNFVLLLHHHRIAVVSVGAQFSCLA